MHPVFRWAALLGALSYLGACPSFAQQTPSGGYELRGKVINALSNEPVARALVEIPGQSARFTQSDGAFVFTGLSSGRIDVTARKPGFFNERQLGRWVVPDMSIEIPNSSELIIKLVPEAIIYGEVKNSDGKPLEGVSVSAERWHMVDGRRQLQPTRQVTTDDQGYFRLAELVPGKYCLAFMPVRGGGFVQSRPRAKRKAEEGYGPLFYPEAPDSGSAAKLEIRAGAQLHISQTLSRERLFQASGTVSGALDDTPSISLLNPSGEYVSPTVRFDPKTRAFQITGIPSGAYLLTAMQMRPGTTGDSESAAPLTATLPLRVTSDLSGIVLSLGSGISLGVQLHDEITGTNGLPHRALIRIIPKDFVENSLGQSAVVIPPDEHATASRFQNLSPGTYLVEAQAIVSQGYVSSLRCGSVDLLRDDLVVAAGAALPPIEVTLRDDAAQLTVALKEKVRAASVLVYSSEYPRRSVLVPALPGANSVSIPNLPPGNYQILAVADVDDLEYRNPAAMEKYLSHALSVTLQPNDNLSITAEVSKVTEPWQ